MRPRAAAVYTAVSNFISISISISIFISISKPSLCVINVVNEFGHALESEFIVRVHQRLQG
jgi:hypothetical protein